jgi:TrmH family RNA methyltransferase
LPCFNRPELAEQRSRFVRRKPQDPVTRRDESLAFSDSWQPPAWFGRFAVVLVEPTDAVNIGGVVRAMANTGFLQLRLVRPVEFEPWHIGGIAHYTQHIVSATQVFGALPAAVADRQLVLGLTGRHHRVERNALPFAEAMRGMAETAQSGQEVAVVFGREDWGLSNQMLDACHFVTTIPTNPAYPSLNLAQAALLVLYELFERAEGFEQSYRPPRRVSPAAPSALLEDLVADLERALEAVEFFHSRSRVSAMRSLRVALYRARLDVREASLLRAVVLEIRKFLVRKGLREDVGPVGYAQGGESNAE